jgi:hypothetical protein
MAARDASAAFTVSQSKSKGDEMPFSRLIVPCLAALLAVTALSASSAQAAKWIILNSKGEAKDAAGLVASLDGEIENKFGFLLAEVLKMRVGITCKKLTPIGFSLEGEGKLTTGGKVKFSECTTEINSKAAPECTPKSAGLAAGTVETNKLKGRLTLVGSASVIQIEPETGSTFVVMEMGAGCLVGSKLPIIGVFSLTECEVPISTHQVVHLFEEALNSTEIWALSKTAEHRAVTVGSGVAFLAGAHNALEWGGLAE